MRPHGKFCDPAFPKKGWNLQYEYDFGEKEFPCEACERQTVRYVHVVTHPAWPEIISIGCDCWDVLSDVKKGTARKQMNLRKKLVDAWQIMKGAKTPSLYIIAFRGRYSVYLFDDKGSWHLYITNHGVQIFDDYIATIEDAADKVAEVLLS
jgi:hypothetical protein